ncbi:MAG: hypothetical protein Q9190_003216 [Brigantiaea leucoxantha]
MGPVFQVTVQLAMLLLAVFFVKLYNARSFVRKLQRQGFIRQRFPHFDDAFYLDTWPFGPLILVLLSPDMMFQLTQANQIPKDKGLRHFLRPLTGEADLVTLEGTAWKRWRTIFNPGFSANHILTLVPGMVEEVEVFRGVLDKKAKKGDLFFLEEASLSLTIDIIGRVVMDHKFASQTKHNELTTALRNQLEWCTTGMNVNPLEYINIFRPLVHNNIQGDADPRNKSVVDLALKSYLKENPSATGIDAHFSSFAVGQIKLFIFTGHDTTSTGAIFTYHLLAQHLDILSKRLPTQNCLIWSDHCGTHYNPRFWVRPEECIPERFLTSDGNEIYPPKNGWRPFERSPRNCVGQELALTEIKLMLALTIREFDFKDSYKEFDALKKNPVGWNVNGQRAYMMRRVGGHPAHPFMKSIRLL